MTRNTPVPIISERDRAYVRSLVIYEDRYVIVFNKPSGLPVQTRGNKSKNLDYLLWVFAKSNGKRPKLVHRIDAETSGVVIVAKNHPSAVHLSKVFADHNAQKTYHAIVEGEILDQFKGTIEIPLVIRPNNPNKNAVLGHNGMQNAKPAKTLWKVLCRNGRRSLLELTPKTGRTHQLRVHMAGIGCSILGDRMYGTGRLSAERLMLHASSLAISSPNGDKMNFEAPWPHEFQQQVAYLFPKFPIPTPVGTTPSD